MVKSKKIYVGLFTWSCWQEEERHSCDQVKEVSPYEKYRKMSLSSDYNWYDDRKDDDRYINYDFIMTFEMVINKLKWMFWRKILL